LSQSSSIVSVVLRTTHHQKPLPHLSNLN